MKIRGLTIVSIIAFLLLFWINFIDFKFSTIPFFNGKAKNLETITENLSLAYLAAYFFYFINVFLVESREKKIILPFLSAKVKGILHVNERFLSILFQNKKVDISEVSKSRLEKILDEKNLKRLKIYNNENLTLSEYIQKNRQLILSNISETLESGKYVDDELRVLLLKMRQSLFLKENYAFNSQNIELDKLKKYHNVIYIYLNLHRELQRYFEKNLQKYYLLNYPFHFRKKVN